MTSFKISKHEKSLNRNVYKPLFWSNLSEYSQGLLRVTIL